MAILDILCIFAEGNNLSRHPSLFVFRGDCIPKTLWYNFRVMSRSQSAKFEASHVSLVLLIELIAELINLKCLPTLTKWCNQWDYLYLIWIY